MDAYDELIGADLTEHHIRHGQVGVSRAVSALRPFYHATADIQDIRNVGSNPGTHRTMDTDARRLKVKPVNKWDLHVPSLYQIVIIAKSVYIHTELRKICLKLKLD
jgi:hypothetical protein